MYTTFDNVNIEWTYDPRPLLKVTGGNEGEVFLVQIFEYFKNNSYPYFLESHLVVDGGLFDYGVTWHGNFEFRVLRFDEQIGPVEIFRDRYNDFNKPVKFILNTTSKSEQELFLSAVNRYVSETKCIPTIETKLQNSTFPQNYQDLEQELSKNSFDSTYYTTYWVGRNYYFGDNYYEHRWRSISYGNWREFWSFNNPRDYSTLSSVEIAEDILGFTEKDNKHDCFVVTPSYL